MDAYEKALKELDKGEITDTVVKSTYGYHIIKCTGVLKWSGKLHDIGIVPKDIVDNVRKTLQSERFQKWYDNYESDANVKINDMPHGLPYDVSLVGVTKSKNANANGSSSVNVTSVDENGNVVSSDGDNGTSDSTDNTEKATGNASAKSGDGKAESSTNAE